MNRVGKMKNTSGNNIFSGAWSAAACARARRSARSCSDCARNTRATPIPVCSACSTADVKDATPAPELAMRDVGAGTIDWKRIFAQRATAGIKHFLVEHDDPKPDAWTSVTASYGYLARLTW